MSVALALNPNGDGEAMGCKKRRRAKDQDTLQRARERNKLHARRTRERKKEFMSSLQQRLTEVRDELQRLREGVGTPSKATALEVLDAAGIRRTICLDAILRQFDASPGGGVYHFDEKLFGWMLPKAEQQHDPDKTGSVDGDLDHGDAMDDDATADLAAADAGGDAADAGAVASGDAAADDGGGGAAPRGRRLQGLSAVEKQQERRARNRIHARRTRERKKQLLQITQTALHLATAKIESLQRGAHSPPRTPPHWPTDFNSDFNFPSHSINDSTTNSDGNSGSDSGGSGGGGSGGSRSGAGSSRRPRATKRIKLSPTKTASTDGNSDSDGGGCGGDGRCGDDALSIAETALLLLRCGAVSSASQRRADDGACVFGTRSAPTQTQWEWDAGAFASGREGVLVLDGQGSGGSSSGGDGDGGKSMAG